MRPRAPRTAFRRCVRPRTQRTTQGDATTDHVTEIMGITMTPGEWISDNVYSTLSSSTCGFSSLRTSPTSARSFSSIREIFACCTFSKKRLKLFRKSSIDSFALTTTICAVSIGFGNFARIGFSSLVPILCATRRTTCAGRPCANAFA